VKNHCGLSGGAPNEKHAICVGKTQSLTLVASGAVLGNELVALRNSTSSEITWVDIIGQAVEYGPDTNKSQQPPGCYVEEMMLVY
jgi:hypothetical protein